jgi:hypothetical protein
VPWMDFPFSFAVSKTEYNEQAASVLCLAITGYNKGFIDNLITWKLIADTVHSVVGDVQSSTDVVTSISCLLAKHSLCYDLAGKPCSNLFVVDAHPNISVFPPKHICFSFTFDSSLIKCS